MTKSRPIVTESFSGGTYRCISDVLLSVLENLPSFSSCNKNTKRFSKKLLIIDTKNPINPDREIEKENGQKLALGNSLKLSMVKISARSDQIKGSVARVPIVVLCLKTSFEKNEK